MGAIDPLAAIKMQPEMLNGESLHWAGMPDSSVIFHSDDWLLVPFGLFWAAFSIFWEAGVLGYWGNNTRHGGPSLFMALWGIPFIVIGQYLVWGRFFYDAWLKRRTYYAVTNRRVFVLQEGWKRKSSWAYVEAIPTIERDGTRRGTLWFGTRPPMMASRRQRGRNPSRFALGEVPVFADIEDADGVLRLVHDLREAARKESSSGH
jgi:hypothetical protein